MTKARTPLIFTRAGLLALTTEASAQEKEITSSLSLDQLVDAALRENPQLRSRRAKWEAMKVRPVQESALPNSKLACMGMDATAKHDFPHTEEKRLELQQPFPGFGRGQRSIMTWSGLLRSPTPSLRT